MKAPIGRLPDGCRGGPLGGRATTSGSALACSRSPFAWRRRRPRARSQRRSSAPTSPRRSSPLCLPGRRRPRAVAVAAIAAAVASPAGTPRRGSSEHAVEIVVISLGGLLAVGGTLIRTRTAGRSERLGLLSERRRRRRRLAAVARDSGAGHRECRPRLRRHLHDRRDPRRSCLAAGGRVRGRADSDVVEDRLRRRPPRLPDWLVRGERSWRHVPEWWPDDARRGAAADGATRPTTSSSCARSTCARRW